MNHVVGIAPDRRGEVTVGRSAQGIVAFVLWQVDGSLLRPEEQRVGKVLAARPPGGRKNLLQRPRLARHDTVCEVPSHEPELAQDGNGGRKAVWRRPLVHTIRCWRIDFGKHLGDTLVGDEHGLLDQARRRGPLTYAHARWVTVLVNQHLGLARVKVDGATAQPDVLPETRYLIQSPEGIGYVTLKTGRRGKPLGGKRALKEAPKVGIQELNLYSPSRYKEGFVPSLRSKL